MANPWDFTGDLWFAHTFTYPTFEFTAADLPIDGTLLCPYLAKGQVRKLVRTISGLDYLDGQLVSVCGDGIEADTSVVESGSISLNVPAATVHVGLEYTGRVKFLPLGGDGQTVNQGKERKVYDIVIRVWKSLGGMFSKGGSDFRPINYASTENINQNDEDPFLFTGDIHNVPFESSFSNYFVPEFEINQPLPLSLLAVIFRSEISEDK